MNHLATVSSRIPADHLIARLLSQEEARAQAEEDLVDCTLYWSRNFASGGWSSQGALAKSVEAVRVLMSLGLEQSGYDESHLPDPGTAERLRVYFKQPFVALKKARCKSPMNKLLSVKDFDWEDEDAGGSIDFRLYAKIRLGYNEKLERARSQAKKRKCLKELKVKLRIDRDEESVDGFEIDFLIRTLIARVVTPGLNKPRRSVVKRKSAEGLGYQSDDESFSKKEMEKVVSACLPQARDRKKVDENFENLRQDLGELIQPIEPLLDNEKSWSDFIYYKICKALTKKEKKWGASVEFYALCEWFSVDFLSLGEKREVEKSDQKEFVKDLVSIFPTLDSSYSRKELLENCGRLAPGELDKMLRKAERMKLIVGETIERRKRYTLPGSETK